MSSGGLLSLHDQSLAELADRFDQSADTVDDSPAARIEKNFWIPTPRDPVTGDDLPSGMIRLADHQRKIVNEALSKKANGHFRYSTVIYSAPKKSGKSALASAVALDLAESIPYAQIYCVANDGVQSQDRLFIPIWRCLNHHQQIGSDLAPSRLLLTEAYLKNYAHIKPIPVDASGEAGAEPTAIFYSELHGFIEEKKKRLYSEMTIPPTLWGRSIRWIESYAGYKGISDLLWDLYMLSTREGVPHPDFEDMKGRDGEPVVWVNESAHLFCYWDTVARMPWQQGEEGEEYYRQEAKLLSDSEFKRMHWNQWVSPVGAFVDSAHWEADADETIPPLPIGSNVPVVIGIDAAISGDCAAVVAVTRHPFTPDIDIAVRYCKIFKAEPGKPIQIERDIGREIRKLSHWWNIVCVAYDHYQMEGLIQSYRRGEVVITAEETYGMSPEQIVEYEEAESKAAVLWYFDFGQGNLRNVSDKELYDAILGLHVRWNPRDRDSQIVDLGQGESLSIHIKQAGRTETGGKMRIVKLSDEAKVDAAVALSMAHHQCKILNIDNREVYADDLVQQLKLGQITYEEFVSQMALIHTARRLRDGEK